MHAIVEKSFAATVRKSYDLRHTWYNYADDCPRGMPRIASYIASYGISGMSFCLNSFYFLYSLHSLILSH
jgi:hypothetical protein